MHACPLPPHPPHPHPHSPNAMHLIHGLCPGTLTLAVTFVLLVACQSSAQVLGRLPCHMDAQNIHSQGRRLRVFSDVKLRRFNSLVINSLKILFMGRVSISCSDNAASSRDFADDRMCRPNVQEVRKKPRSANASSSRVTADDSKQKKKGDRETRILVHRRRLHVHTISSLTEDALETAYRRVAKKRLTTYDQEKARRAFHYLWNTIAPGSENSTESSSSDTSM